PLGSWEASLRIFACIGTLNQIGTPLPALSPHGGERVAEGRVRGGSWRGNTSKIRTRIEAMNLGRRAGQASSLPVRAASLPPQCSAGKDARRTGATSSAPRGSQHRV